jgi:hypothetical protein
MKLWDVESGKELHTLIPDQAAREVLFFDGGKKILATDHFSFTIFEVATGKRLAKYHRSGSPVPLGMMPDGKKLLISKNNRLELWEPFSGKVVKTFLGETNPNVGTAISWNSKWALVPCLPHQRPAITLQLWDLSTGEIKLSFGPKDRMTGPAAISPNGKLAVAQRVEFKGEVPDKATLALLEMPSGKVVRTFPAGGSLLAFSSDGKELVGVDSLHLRRWNVETGELIWSESMPTNTGVFALSPDGSRVFMSFASSNSEDWEYRALEIWDGVRGEKIRKLKIDKNWIYGEGKWFLEPGNDPFSNK